MIPPSYSPLLVAGQDLTLKLGFSHDTIYSIPQTMRAFLPDPTTVGLYGIDKEEVFAALANPLDRHNTFSTHIQKACSLEVLLSACKGLGSPGMASERSGLMPACISCRLHRPLQTGQGL